MGRRPNPATRERILQEAEHLIHLRGFRGTAMEDIARACRMTKANLFHHYGSKEELGLAVLEAKIRDYRKGRVDPLCASRDPVKAVGCMFKELGRFFDRNGCKAGCLVGNIALEMSDINEPFRKRAGLFFDEWAKGMAKCLARAREGGYFLPSLDPRAAAETIISLYEGAVMLARTRRDASVFGRVGRTAQSLLEQHRNHEAGRRTSMGPKTPCGC